MHSQMYRKDFGGVAQLGEHLPCKQGVRGSNPLISIRSHKLRPDENPGPVP